MLPLSSVELIHREAEQTGKPTYHSYSSIPIEQESGPRAGQSEMVKRDKMAGNRRGGVDNTQKHQSTHVRGKAHRIAALKSRVKEERHWAKVPEGIFNFQSTVTSLHFVKTWFALSFHRKVQVQSLRNDTSFIFITSSLIKRILVRAFFLFFVPDGKSLTWQRQITWWVTLCFGQATVFTDAVLQNVSSRMHPVLWIPTKSRMSSLSLKHITDCSLRTKGENSPSSGDRDSATSSVAVAWKNKGR